MGHRAGHVTGQRIGKVKGMPVDMRILQVAFTDENYPETVILFSESGEDTCPAVGDMVYAIPVGSESSKISLVTHDKITPTAAAGEKRIYSQAAGVVKASIHLKANGAIDIITLSAVNVTGDVLINKSATIVSGHDHIHLDSWGRPTGAPLAVGASPPSPPATVVIESNIDMNTNSKTIDGVDVDQHTHDVAGVQAGGLTITSTVPN